MSFLGPVTTLAGRRVRPARHRGAHRAASRTRSRREVARLQRVGFEVRVEMTTPRAASDTWVQLTRGQTEALRLHEGAPVWLLPGPTARASARRLTGAARRAGRRLRETARMSGVQISAKTDYAVRALLSLAAREPELVKIDTVVTEQGTAAQVRRGHPR